MEGVCPYDYISLATGLLLDDFDDSVPCYVLDRLSGWGTKTPPDYFSHERRPTDCDLLSHPDHGWVVITHNEKRVMYNNDKDMLFHAKSHAVPVKLIKYLMRKPRNKYAWIRGPPQNKSRPGMKKSSCPPILTKTRDPVPVEHVPAPVPVEHVPAPVPVEHVPAPVPVEPVPAPVSVEQVPAPVSVEQVPAPVSVEQVPAPVQASTPPPPPIPISIPVESVPPTEAVQEPIAEQSKKKKKRRLKKKTVPLPVPDPVQSPQIVVETEIPVHSEEVLAPEKQVEEEPTPPLKRSTNIAAFFGYDQTNDKYAFKYENDDTIRWNRKYFFEDTDPRWFEIAKKHGMPSFDHQLKSFKPLVGGVVTRRQFAASSSSAMTSGVPVQFNDGGALCCLTASYLNLATGKLSEGQRASILNLAISESQLTKKLRDEAYPLRMIHPLPFRGAPQKAGDYLISLTEVHTDGLRVLPTGGLLFFPSDPRVSTFVLTEEDDYVKEHIINRVHPYRAIELVCATAEKPRENLSNAERRALAKKRKLNK